MLLWWQAPLLKSRFIQITRHTFKLYLRRNTSTSIKTHLPRNIFFSQKSYSFHGLIQSYDLLRGIAAFAVEQFTITLPTWMILLFSLYLSGSILSQILLITSKDLHVADKAQSKQSFSIMSQLFSLTSPCRIQFYFRLHYCFVLAPEDIARPNKQYSIFAQ